MSLVNYLVALEADSCLFYELFELAEREEDFMLSREFQIAVFDRIKTQQQQHPPALHEFKANWYSLILEKSGDFVLDIAHDINNSDLWKYSSKIIFILVGQTEIDDFIKELADKSRAGNRNFELLQHCEYLDQIEEALKQEFNGNFAVLLGDYMLNTLEIELHEGSYFGELEACFEWSIRSCDLDQGEYPNLLRLLQLAVMKKHLDSFASTLCKTESLSETELERLNKTEEFLLTEHLGATANHFVAKLIYQLRNYDDDKFVDWISRKVEAYRFLQPYAVIQPPVVLNIFPYISDLPHFDSCNKVMRQLLQCDSGQLKSQLYLLGDAKQKLAFILAFINNVFAIHCTDGLSPDTKKWLTTQISDFVPALGQEGVGFFRCLIDNFPHCDYMQLSRDRPANEVHRILSMCFVMGMLLAYKNEVNPLTDLFFEHGKLPKDFASRFNSKYVLGTEPNPMHNYLKYVQENFESLKSTTWRRNYSRGSAYVCSNECNYMYFIENCGGAVVESTCPFCKSTIGGRNHQQVERPGHRNLTDDEAKEFLQEKVTEYEERPTKGRQLFQDEPSDCIARGLKSPCYKVIHFILDASMYMSLITGMISPEQLQQVLNIPGGNFDAFFQKSIAFDLSKLSSLIDCGDLSMWLYKALGVLPTTLESTQDSAGTADARNQFEVQFGTLIDTFIESPLAAVQQYEIQLTTLRGQSDIQLKYIKELCKNESLEYIAHFRLTEQPSMDRMERVFRNVRQGKEFSLVDVLFQNAPDLNNLQLLWPLVELTNALLKLYSHQITREDARTKTMRELVMEHPDILSLFDRFLEAWTLYCPSELQYECTTLSAVQYSMDSALINFLPDSKDEGLYMLTAMTQLATTQNKVLSNAFRLLSESKRLDSEGILQYNVQRIKQKNILKNSLEDPEVISRCCVNSPLYGCGREVVYSFERIQKNIVQTLLDNKFLSKNFTLMPYQLELLGLSDSLITGIRQVLPQSKFTKAMKKDLDEHFKARKNQDPNRYPAALKELYGSLSFVLCYLKNVQGEPSMTIHDYCRQFTSENSLRTVSFVTAVPLKHIISLYEKVELEYFPYLVRNVRSEFKLQDNTVGVQKIVKSLMQQHEIPSMKHIKKALMRLIVRCLNIELNPEQPLVYYLIREDFWPEDFGPKIDALEIALSNAPIFLKDAFEMYNAFEEFPENQPQPGSPVAPRAKRMAPRRTGNTKRRFH